MSLPPPPAVPGLPLIGNSLDFRRDPVKLFRKGYEAFGPVFSIKLGPKRAAVILGPENHRFFFSETDRALSMSEVYRVFIPIFGDGFTLAAEPDEYREQRAILQPAFSGQRMDENVRVMVRETLEWLDGLGDEGEFELVASIEELSLHIIASALMGEEFRRRMGEDFWPLYRDVVGGLDFVLPPNLPLPRFRRRDRARRILHERIRSLVLERRAHANGHGDFLQTLADAKYSDGRPVPEDKLQSMILFLVFSASESTPLQASWTLIQLLQHPDYLSLVLEEQETTFGGRAEEVSPESLQRLERLQWAVRETERLRPMITMLWRYNLRSYGIGDYEVPKGWSTIICPPLSHRLPEVFADPERYDPERFSPRRAEDRKELFSMAGFGGGAHKCPGMHFAHTLMKVVFSLLLQRYTLELLNPDPQPDFSHSITRPEACPVRYRRR
jgi:sterol 14-demethylase